MDGARLSPFPRPSWLGFAHTATKSDRGSVFTMRHVNHKVVVLETGSVDVRWISRGRERRFWMHEGQVGFFPADDNEHTVVVQPETTSQAFILSLPIRHLDVIAGLEGLDSAIDFRPVPVIDDAMLSSSMLRLSRGGIGHGVAEECGSDSAARALVVRLIALMGGGFPDWQADSSVFSGHTMGHLVDYIDSCLHRHLMLDELAAIVGLSPSHCAKKFRQTAGLSVHRFIIRRRLQASLPLLKDGSTPLVKIALDLGFASQSHFTRLFSSLIGITPARFRRDFGAVRSDDSEHLRSSGVAS